jgi:hypothetical protein
MINPHFLDVVLPLDVVLEAIGGELQMLASFPRFDADWRWFKDLTRDAWNFNARFLASYRANILNFIDHKRTFAPIDAAAAAPLEAAFARLHSAAVDYQRQIERGAPDGAAVAGGLRDLAGELGRNTDQFAAVMDELISVWSLATPTPRDVSGMRAFGQVFGRENVYLSLTRLRA